MHSRTKEDASLHAREQRDPERRGAFKNMPVRGNFVVRLNGGFELEVHILYTPE